MYKYTNIKGLDSREITDVIHRKQKRDEHDASFQSSHTQHKTHLHTMKVYNTPTSIIAKFAHKDSSLLGHLSTHLFQSNQRFQAIEFVDRSAQEKFDIFFISKTFLLSLKACFTRYTHDALTSRDSYPQFPRSRLRTPGTMTSLLAPTHEKKRNPCIFRVPTG